MLFTNIPFMLAQYKINISPCCYYLVKGKFYGFTILHKNIPLFLISFYISSYYYYCQSHMDILLKYKHWKDKLNIGTCACSVMQIADSLLYLLFHRELRQHGARLCTNITGIEYFSIWLGLFHSLHTLLSS